jgi:hypothetical protein
MSIKTKQHQDHTTITLNQPTTEINIMGNHKITKVTQDKLGRIYINVNPRPTQKNKLLRYPQENQKRLELHKPVKY